MDGGGGGGSGMPEIRLPPSRGNNHVPEMNSAARSRVLTRIMKDQAQFLNTRSQPSDDFGAADLSWYWESSDKRTRNLEYMYRSILNHCTTRQPVEDPRVLVALSALCEGSLKDSGTFKMARFGLPNWFTAALILWMTLIRANNPTTAAAAGAAAGAAAAATGEGMQGQGQQQQPPAPAAGGQGQPAPASAAGGDGKDGRGGAGGPRSGAKLCEEVFAPFVVEQCRAQVETFLKIIEVQLLGEEFLYLHIKDRPGQQPRIWISRSGLPPLPVPVVLAIVRCVKALFQHEPPPVTLGVGAGVVGTTSIRELAVKAEKTVEEIMKSPPNLAITFTIGGGGAVPGAPPSGGAAAAASGTAVAAGAGGRS